VHLERFVRALASNAEKPVNVRRMRS